MFESLQASAQEDLREYWAWLSQMKQDVKSNLELGLHSMIIKDYKLYEMNTAKMGVASTVVPLGVMFDHFGEEKVAAIS